MPTSTSYRAKADAGTAQLGWPYVEPEQDIGASFDVSKKIGKRYGYARASTIDQDTSVQIAQLEKAGCNVVLQEKQSGTRREARDKLETILSLLDDGDQLVVTKLDRLARDLFDLQAIVKELEAKGASLKVLDQDVNTNTAAGKAFFQMLGVFAEFETNIRHEGQMAGIEAAKKRGVYAGRPKKVDSEEAKKLDARGMTIPQIAE
jgi:DNA invertase Pin-like site-specific DNA recombinase